jgi:hypothetical protein
MNYMAEFTAFSTLMFRDRLLTRAVQYRDRKGAAEQASRKCIKTAFLPACLEPVLQIRWTCAREREFALDTLPPISDAGHVNVERSRTIPFNTTRYANNSAGAFIAP